MRKVILTVMAIFVAAMFASVAVAATSSPCTTCAKPCNTCAKPCNTCATPCKPLPKVCIDWRWPKVTLDKCAPCAPCGPVCVMYKRDALGQKVPVQSMTAVGDANTDTATKYENTLISGN
ncbi:MAG: hypothetical protein JXB40_05130 [Candidatus Omnitrophica bacterium]|nr:hypothetical protein [Candidatus Omnitrophota bacterium]